MKTAEILGTQPGTLNLAAHRFEKDDAGNVVHYIDGEKRAEIAAAHWADYCDACDEAHKAAVRWAEQETPAPTPVPAP